MTSSDVAAFPVANTLRSPISGPDVVTEPERLLAMLPEINLLARACGAPMTSHGPWLEATLATGGDVRPWAVVLRRGGQAVAAVVLLDQIVDLRETVTLAGTDLGEYRGAVLSRSEGAARHLGQAVAAALLLRRKVPDLQLGPLAANNAHVDAFLTGLGTALDLEPSAVPLVRVDGIADATELMTHGMRRTLRKARNRLERDGARAVVGMTSHEDTIEALTSELAQHHRDRDHARGRGSDLDDERLRELWHARIRGLAAAGLLELWTLRIDDRLAAYVLGVVEGGTYRLLEGRLVTRWARYSPGRLLETAVLGRVVSHPALSVLDWMSPVASESLLCQNGSEPVITARLRRAAGFPR